MDDPQMQPVSVGDRLYEANDGRVIRGAVVVKVMPRTVDLRVDQGLGSYRRRVRRSEKNDGGSVAYPWFSSASAAAAHAVERAQGLADVFQGRVEQAKRLLAQMEDRDG